jgi:hypothetical protein
VFKQMLLKSHSILSKPIDDKAWRQLSTSQKFGLKIGLKFGLLEMGSKPRQLWRCKKSYETILSFV